MYESDRRRAAPLTSLYMQRTPAARAVSPRMARTDAIQRPVEPPNPPIVESAQPVLPLGGAPIQARISPGSKPERIARRRAQRAAQPTLSAAFPPATKCGTTARAASQASTRIAIRFCGGWARGRCVQTPLHAFSTAVGLQGRTDNIQISLKGAVQDAKLCTTR